MGWGSCFVNNNFIMAVFIFAVYNYAFKKRGWVWAKSEVCIFFVFSLCYFTVIYGKIKKQLIFKSISFN